MESEVAWEPRTFPTLAHPPLDTISHVCRATHTTTPSPSFLPPSLLPNKDELDNLRIGHSHRYSATISPNGVSIAGRNNPSPLPLPLCPKTKDLSPFETRRQWWTTYHPVYISDYRDGFIGRKTGKLGSSSWVSKRKTRLKIVRSDFSCNGQEEEEEGRRKKKEERRKKRRMCCSVVYTNSRYFHDTPRGVSVGY